ncbi:sensor histidine kinase [Paenibacillus xylanivorans]|uniref:Signal transduction histidine kinase internal region domain-containing protein n=1 Tax=Paenibacillus xylanivorans TaxID=1705561 RepID=A0A0M9BJC3_9BACL|nr:histidine kinase [Paenibacillus xylanivorans]KOY12616.1 hypothetical protein AMS66_29855 [Paenibacillus xylanivorans]
MILFCVATNFPELKTLGNSSSTRKNNSSLLVQHAVNYNWIAIENNQTKISHITNNLATYYRTALNHGKDLSTLGIELDNIKSYIALQQIARDESFDVVYDVSPSLLQCIVPNFILQPIIENAIEHGIDTLREGNGVIVIKSEVHESKYNICISDNGKELYEKYGGSEFAKSMYGYGLRNVNERIRLKTNFNYGIRLYSSSDGTKAVLTLPNYLP